MGSSSQCSENVNISVEIPFNPHPFLWAQGFLVTALVALMEERSLYLDNNFKISRKLAQESYAHPPFVEHTSLASTF